MPHLGEIVFIRFIRFIWFCVPRQLQTCGKILGFDTSSQEDGVPNQTSAQKVAHAIQKLPHSPQSPLRAKGLLLGQRDCSVACRIGVALGSEVLPQGKGLAPNLGPTTKLVLAKTLNVWLRLEFTQDRPLDSA